MFNDTQNNITGKARIKVIGVGGAGNNAVNRMINSNITSAEYVVVNTDSQILALSPCNNKIQIGRSLTKGLGAGADPEVGRAAAEESKDELTEAIKGTDLLFITAGMGGGTGTGASAVVASVAQEMGILTVGIVTIPFLFEGKKKITKALKDGVHALAGNVDALLIINNEKLKKIYPDFDLPNAFAKADEVLCNAAKSIAEIITVTGYINTDFQDVYNTLKEGGIAIMNVGRASGSDDQKMRVTRAIEDALNSPIVNMNDVCGASRILLNFYCSHDHAVVMSELDEINEFVARVGDDVEVNWGASYDEEMGEDVRVTIIATGYEVKDIPSMEEFYPELDDRTYRKSAPETPDTPEGEDIPLDPDTPPIGFFDGGEEPEEPKTPMSDEKPVEVEISLDDLNSGISDSTPAPEEPDVVTPRVAWFRRNRK